MTKDNNFEILLYLAAEACAQDDVNEFLSKDVSAYPITPELCREAYNVIKQSKRKPLTVWKTVKYAAVACLICMSICFTACMCIPEVRNAIKEAFVRWYDEYIEIGFGDDTGADTTPPYAEDTTPDSNTDSTEPSENALSDLPQTIEKKAYATYLPEGYVEEVRTDNSLYLILTYTFNEDMKFYLKQIPIDQYLIWADSTDKNVTKENVNGDMAILTKDETDNNKYTLVWQSNEYEFSLHGIFESKNELIKIAEGIKIS